MRPIKFLFRVVDDPERTLRGELRGELTDVGLVLRETTARDGEQASVVVPIGRKTLHLGSRFLLLECPGRAIKVALMNRGVDQVRLARDLADFLNARRQYLHEDDYRLSKGLVLLSLLPFGIVAICAAVMLLSAFSLVQTILLTVWCLAALCLAAWLFRWSRSGTPAVAVRVLAGLALTLASYVLPAAILGASLLARFDWNRLAAQPEPEEWVEFVDPNKQFRIDMPGHAKRQQEPMPGQKDAFIMHGVDLKRTAFLVGHLDIPPQDFNHVPLAQRFNASRDGMLQKAPGTKLLSEKTMMFEGYPGREVILQTPDDNRLIARMLAVETRYYLLLAVGPDYQPDAPAVRRFFNSFRITTPTNVAAPTSFEGLLAYWSFDEADGGQALDASSGDNHLKIDTGIKRISGKRGKALHFKGTQSVSLGVGPRLNFNAGAPFTVAGWFKSPRVESNSILFFNDSRNDQVALYVSVTKNVLSAGVNHKGEGRDPIRAFAQTRVEVGDNLWHHFAMIRQPDGIISLYLDGEFVEKSPVAAPGAIRTNQRKIGQQFDGAVDELCVYNRVLSEREIQALAGKIADFIDRPAPPLKFIEEKDTEPPDPLLAKFFAHNEVLNSLHFSPDGKKLLGGVRDAYVEDGIQIWDVETQKPLHKILGRGPLQLADQGRKLLFPAVSRTYVFLHDLDKLAPIPVRFDGSEHRRGEAFFALSSDESFVLTSDLVPRSKQSPNSTARL